MKDSGTLFKDITTLRVGGLARRVVHPESKEACISLIEAMDAKAGDLLVLGGGSNILGKDEPYEGTVIIPSFDSVSFESDNNASVRVVADAGAVWDTVVKETVERDVWGLENLSAIPGTVGAAPMQNIGAYGADVSETVEWVEVYDRTQKYVRRLANAELQFLYRSSILKKQRGRFVVLRVSFILSRTPRPNLAYKDLALWFGGGDGHPELGSIRDAVIEIRRGKFPNLAEHGTAGSFFLNPIVPDGEAAALISEYPELPHFPEKGGTKLSLAWILDHVVEAKGKRVGGAFVWNRQPLVIATEEGATARDVRTLTKAIQEKVFDATNLLIVPEVFFV